jgi:predicted DNA-binding transcriptional regulator YafY
MASRQTLERRIAALEARLADVEGGYGDTLYKLHRASVKADLRLKFPDLECVGCR